MSAGIALGVVFWFVCSVAGGYVASEKGRPLFEGMVFGALFGPIGLIVEAMLPTQEAAWVKRVQKPQPRTSVQQRTR